MLDIDRIKKELESMPPAPIHTKLRQAIQIQILDGTLEPGESLPSERSLKESLDLSRATIRSAMSSLIQANFLHSVPSIGTYVLDPRKAETKAGLIGLIVTGPNFHFFYPQLAASFNARIRQAGYGMMMSLHNDFVDSLEEVVDQMLAQNVLAIALVPPRYGNINSVIAKLHNANVPFIFIGRRGNNPLIDSVTVDNVQVGYQATKHLINLGHRRIVHVGFQDYSTGQDRAEGYLNAMKEAGLTPTIIEPEMPQNLLKSGVTPNEHLADPTYQTVVSFLKQSTADPFSAMFCFNDVVAMGAYKAVRDMNLHIPSDISLISVDDLPTIRHFEVPLTTFGLPSNEIGIQGAAILLRRINGEEISPKTYLLPAQIVKRASSAPLITSEVSSRS